MPKTAKAKLDLMETVAELRGQLDEAKENYSTLREALKQSDDNRLKLLSENTDLQREMERLKATDDEPG